MSEFVNFLRDVGVSVAATKVTDIINSYMRNSSNPTWTGLEQTLSSQLNIQGAQITSSKIIEFLAKSGNLNIQGSQIYARDKVTIASTMGTQFTLANNSESRTDKSSIFVGYGSQIVGNGNAKIEQTEDGGIVIST